jgi:hypothetical protein
MQKSIWDDYTAFMVEAGLISELIDSTRAFTNDFLP